MRYYKELRVCRICKTRFVVEHRSNYYCAKCQKKYNAYKKKEEMKKDGRSS